MVRVKIIKKDMDISINEYDDHGLTLSELLNEIADTYQIKLHEAVELDGHIFECSGHMWLDL